MQLTKNVMVMGTSSNVGKSVICTALCRIFAQDGLRVAPFKSQNMSLNSAVTPSGCEIGRAQAVQAEACGILPNEHMNPVLLKPMNHNRAQVIVQGKVYDTESAEAYFAHRTEIVWDAVVESYQFLADRHELIVIEGAGSPVEMNLKAREIANMRTAELANADVLLVADIDRGGIFASLVGTLQLLQASERERVKGIIVNKFRGDPTLFESGVRMLEEYTSVPVLGVIPYMEDIGIEEEDSVVLSEYRNAASAHATTRTADNVKIAIIQFPHISNFTDFDALFLEPAVTAYYCRRSEDLGNPHAIVLPGTKNTLDDLAWLYETGFVDAIARAKSEGAVVFGVCGGYQMLGTSVEDPDGRESDLKARLGFAWLPVTTTMLRQKRTVLVRGHLNSTWFSGIDVKGYEIHMGETYPLQGYMPFASIQSDLPGFLRHDGAVSEDGAIAGTYLHGIFDNDAFRRAWLTHIQSRFGLQQQPSPNMSMAKVRSEAFDRVADVVRKHLNMDMLYEIVGTFQQVKARAKQRDEETC